MVRATAPITLESCLSKKARSITGNDPFTPPADICRYGENKLDANNPIEK